MIHEINENILLNFKFRNEATRDNLQVNKRMLKWRPFWNEVYIAFRSEKRENHYRKIDRI